MLRLALSRNGFDGIAGSGFKTEIGFRPTAYGHRLGLAKVLADEPANRSQVADFVNGLFEVVELGDELREVTARSRESPQSEGRAVIAELSFDQLQQRAASFDGTWIAAGDTRLKQFARLLEDPRIAETSATDRDTVGSGLTQEAHCVGW